MKALLNFSDPAEARTQDPQIKSLLLYQLSYGVGHPEPISQYRFGYGVKLGKNPQNNRKSHYNENNFFEICERTTD